MGLFSFLKEAGAKLFGKKEEVQAIETATNSDSSIQADVDAIRKQTREATLMSEVAKMGLQVENFSVDLQDDIVIVYGQCETQADKEKVVLTLGNVEGVASVDDRLEVKYPEEDSQFHEVVSGDTLSKLAKYFYGDPMKYPIIFEANQPMLTDPDLIYPGQVLRIPPIS